MTSHAEQAVSFQPVLVFIDTGEVIPDPPEMGKPELPKETEKFPIGLFGRVIQAAVAPFYPLFAIPLFVPAAQIR